MIRDGDSVGVIVNQSSPGVMWDSSCEDVVLKPEVSFGEHTRRCPLSMHSI